MKSLERVFREALPGIEEHQKGPSKEALPWHIGSAWLYA
jgi:hypothetical protein